MRIAAAILVIGVTSAAHAQSYRPVHSNPRGTQLVAVYLGAASCGPCRLADTKTAVDSAKVLLQQQARQRGQQFRAVFVSMDWEPDSGLVVARENGQWDELILGRNWTNLGAVQYIWLDSATVPAMPQIIVYEEDVVTGVRVTLSPRRVIHRVYGAPAMLSWVRAGAPIPAVRVLPN